MNIKINGILAFFILILSISIRSSHQTTYTCNPNVSCGCSANSATVNRIVNGEDAQESTWSWTVSIRIGFSLCGGSILTDSWIISAAHCFYNNSASDVTVYAGSNLYWEGRQIRTVSQIVIHPDYCKVVSVNDIALLRLSSPLNMSDSRMKRICVPDINSNITENNEWPYVDTNVVAVGWGDSAEGVDGPSNLQQVTLQVIGFEEPTCVPVIKYPPAEFCAGVENSIKDTCQGDSGGPLMMFSSTRQWILVGLVSRGIGCARPGYSGIYTRVAAFENWIKSYVNNAVWITEPVAINPDLLTTTTTYPPITLHANIIVTSIYNILIITFLNFLVAVYF